jgi:predicted enzyme related to lactoylglutathione lyase
MGERTSYPPGTFSWAEPPTSDAGGAKSFYSSLFGWDYDDNPIGDGQVYSIARRDGKSVAALFASGQPPHWNCCPQGAVFAVWTGEYEDWPLRASRGLSRAGSAFVNGRH